MATGSAKIISTVYLCQLLTSTQYYHPHPTVGTPIIVNLLLGSGAFHGLAPLHVKTILFLFYLFLMNWLIPYHLTLDCLIKGVELQTTNLIYLVGT